ncbi:MAG TPA: hypothetical protein DCE41_16060, partial [Cytophagales bacterium]|nr:hypothetical protein [Cytophagales bacterium]
MSKSSPEEAHKAHVLRLKQALERYYALRREQPRSWDPEWTLNPTLTEPELAQFEQQHGFRLPAEYRAYLKYLSNGLDAPVGLFPLSKNYPLNRVGLSPEEKERAFAKAALPFPYREAEIEQHQTQFKQLGGWGPSAAADHSRQGALILADDGCDQLTLLEVTGDQPDRLWFDDMANAGYMYPEADSFLDWLTVRTHRALAETEFDYGLVKDDLDRVKSYLDPEHLYQGLHSAGPDGVYRTLGRLPLLTLLERKYAAGIAHFRELEKEHQKAS